MSIKNRFATAVATASLLAGLFGSAFVPSASAAIVESPDVVLAKYTTLTEGSEVHQAGTAKSFGFQSLDSDDGAVDANAYIDIALYSAGSSGEGTTAYDFDDTVKNENVQLKAVSSNSNVNVGWAYDNDEDPASTEACNGDITVGTTSIFTDIEGIDGAGLDNDETFRLCFAGETDATAATSTITVTVDGVVATTFSVTAVGPIDSLTASITDGYKYLAEDNDYLDEWLTIVAKDAAGVQINGTSTSVSNEELTLDDWTDNPENQYGDQMGFFQSSMDGDTIGTGTAYTGYDVETDVCYADSGEGDDGDAGFSYTLKVEDDSGDVVSNGITITCTLNSDGARVTAVTPEVASASGSKNANGGLTYNETAAGSDDDLTISATVVDENGAPLGDGADCVDFDWDFEGDADLEWTDNDCMDATGGEVEIGYLEPDTTRFGRFTYIVTALDSDLAITAAGDDAVEKAFTKTFTAVNSASTATLSKVRNAAKTTAVFTADMGEDAAYDVVTFTVELKRGIVVEYNRRANANGVAKLTLSKRNTTVYVYASYLDDTNVLKCVFR
jgi:hypothetical protein